MRQIQKSFALSAATLAVGVLVSACGGGDATAPAVTYSTGHFVDGYINGGTVLCDTNGNGMADAGEATTKSDAYGFFKFDPKCPSPLVGYGGTNVDTKAAFTGTYKAQAGATVLTPLTTLIAAGLTQSQVNTALGLPADTNINATDPAATTGGVLNNADLMKKTLVVQQLVQKTAELLGNLGGVSSTNATAMQPLYTEVASALATSLKAGGTVITGTTVDASQVTKLVAAAAAQVAKSTTLPSTVTAGVKSVDATTLATVSALGLAAQAQPILDSTTADTIKAATVTAQADTKVSDYVVQKQTSLTANSTSAATMATELQGLVKGTTTPTTPDSGTVLASFDETTLPTVSGFDGAEGTSIAAGPTGGSANALKIVRSGGKAWAGAKVSVSSSINLTTANHTISARVYSPTAGIPIDLKLEIPPNGATNTGDIHATETVVAGWQTLTWVVPTTAFNAGYKDIVILPNNGTAASVTPGETYYVDDIKLIATAAPAPVVGTVLTSFDETTLPTVSGFDGAEGTSIAAGPTGGSANALKIVRSGGKAWAGAKVSVSSSINLTTANHTISARVYSPTAGIPIDLKLEVPPNGATNTGDIHATETVVVGWQTLTWVVPTTAFNAGYKDIVILPNNGTPASVTPGETYYIDDIKLIATAAAPVVTPPVSTASVIVNFDEATPGAFEGFDGGVMTLATDAPAGGSGKVAKIVRNPGATWAGAKIAVAKIPLTATRKTLTARVWSSKANAKIQLKLENAAGTVAFESPAGTPAITAANTWQTMTFDVSGADLTANYTSMVMLPDNGTQGSGEIYYFDDITLVDNPVVTPSTTAEMGSAGAVTIPVAVAADNFGFIAVGDAVFAGDYVGSLDSTNKLGAWPNATTTGLASNGNIGYYNDPLMGSSAQKVEEGGWVSGTNVDANGVHNFFRYFTFTGAASTFANSYMGLFVNAPNNGKVNVSTYANMKLKVWGPAEMYNRTNFHPTLEVILAGPKVAGCTTTGSGGTELSKTFSANQTIGAGSNYKLPLTGWTVKGVCGTDTSSTAVASVLGGLARVAVNVPGSSFNFTNANTGSSPAAYSTGVNLGPIAFTNN